MWSLSLLPPRQWAEFACLGPRAADDAALLAPGLVLADVKAALYLLHKKEELEDLMARTL